MTTVPAATPETPPARGATSLLVVATLVTVAVATFAFIGSFRAMADYAEHLGLAADGWSWTFPAVIDGTVLVSAFVTVARGLRRARTWHATVVNLTAVAVSVAVNVAHAPRDSVEAQALAAVFPVFLAGCAHLVFAEVRDLIDRSPRAVGAGASGRVARRLLDKAAGRIERALEGDRPALAPAGAAYASGEAAGTALTTGAADGGAQASGGAAGTAGPAPTAEPLVLVPLLRDGTGA